MSKQTLQRVFAPVSQKTAENGREPQIVRTCPQGSWRRWGIPAAPSPLRVWGSPARSSPCGPSTPGVPLKARFLGWILGMCASNRGSKTPPTGSGFPVKPQKRMFSTIDTHPFNPFAELDTGYFGFQGNLSLLGICLFFSGDLNNWRGSVEQRGRTTGRLRLGLR